MTRTQFRGGRSSGRGGRGRGSNRGGRGGRSGRGSSSNRSSAQATKTKLEEHVYRVGTASQATDYVTITRFVIAHIKEKFTKGGAEIAWALENEEEYDFETSKPQMKMCVPVGEEETFQETMLNKQYELEYQQALRTYSERLEIYRNNRDRVAGLLWNRCNRAMQSKIENRKEYESKIKGNPIELLKAIKEHALSYQETKWDILTIIDAMKAFVNLKQKEDEGLIDYLKRFKTARDVFVSHLGGPLILTKKTQSHESYQTLNDESTAPTADTEDSSDEATVTAATTGSVEQKVKDNNKIVKECVVRNRHSLFQNCM